jgi:arylformamidase
MLFSWVCALKPELKIKQRYKDLIIMNWDDAYANAPYIKHAETYPHLWSQAAKAFRASCKPNTRAQLDIDYGTDERHKVDIFWPHGQPLGLIFFVHGGFWRAFDKNSWSHLAAALVSAGWAVAMPSYRLSPSVSLEKIGDDVVAALNHVASIVKGPIVLAGHSAGGQLVTMMMTNAQKLPDFICQRIVRVISISGLHDLTPLIKTAMNQDFGLDQKTAQLLSPALQKPVIHAPLTCWVGGDERPEFIRQNQLIADAWKEYGISVEVVLEPNKHHFDVIDGLTSNIHPLFSAISGAN